MPNNELKLKVVLVDDEKEATRNLQNILADYIDAAIDIAGIAHSAAEAEAIIARVKPDAVFLDIEMPKENAFHFLKRIAPFDFEVIFVTAYDEYAIRAFKLNAIDYLLKPISISELAMAVSKLKDRIRYKHLLGERHAAFTDLATDIAEPAKVNKITLKGNNIIEIVRFDEIIYIEANGGYSRVFFVKDGGSMDILTSYSIADYEELLPADLFYRVHKSYLINCTYIYNMLREDSVSVVMFPDAVVPVSRRRITPLLEYLKAQSK